MGAEHYEILVQLAQISISSATMDNKGELYFVRTIIESYGGKVEVVTQLEVETNFVFTIPRE